MQNWWQSIAQITILLLFVTVALAGEAYFISTEKAGYLPVIMLVGVVVLLLTLAAVVGIFSYFGLAPKGEALGLPDGSVRAIIALSLVLLFAIVTMFMYSDLSKHGQVLSTPELTDQERDAFERQVPAAQIIKVQTVPAAAAPNAPAAGAANEKFKILYRDAPSPVSEDFAKQLMVLLGTLVTSVASFYFGANAVSGEHPAVRAGDTGDMKLTGVDGSPIQPSSGKQPIAINGSNLGKVNDVTFRQGNDTIYAEINKVEDAKVTCTVSLKGTESGKWDVIVSDGMNLKKLPDALEIKARGP